jgi:prolyl-tRNA synthetase
MILNLRQGDAATDAACSELYTALIAKGLDVLYDDREDRPGAKFATADLIGVPWQVMIGPRSLAEGKVEVKCRADGSRELMTPQDAVAKLTQ